MTSVSNRRLLGAMFAAIATVSLMQPVLAETPDNAAPAATDDKLLGGPDAYGDGYADPYGRADQPAAKKGPSADNMADDANAAATNGSFVKPGSTAFKSTRAKTRDAAPAAGNATGLNGATPSAKKTIEIYKSPY